MTALQQEHIRPLPLHITATGRFSNLGFATASVGGSGIANTAWPANNRAIYSPISLPSRFTVARFMIANGNATGNIDIGLYNANGSLLISTGTQARSGSSVVQYYDVTDQAFPAGDYYLALVASTTSATVSSNNGGLGGPVLQGCGLLQEDLGSTVLPATMTPAQYASVICWYYGFTQSATL